MDFSDEQKETNGREGSDELASTYWNLQNNNNKVITPKNDVYVIEKKTNEQSREAKEQIIRNLSVENSNAANADKITVDHDPLRKARWRSLWLATLILFLVSVQFSIYFSSLWPYMDKICPNADETFFGFVVAGYSLGQMIASPVFAKWTNRIRQVRLPVAVAIVITLAGNFVYIFTEAFPANDRKWVLLGTRFVMGLSAGVVGVLRAYVATASKLEERHRAIAMATGAYSLGLTAGPIIQAALSPIGYPISGYPSGQIFFFNEYTAPAFVSMLASVILLVLLLLIFREHYEGVVAQKQQGNKTVIVPKFDKVAAGLCIWFWFTMFFCITNIETIESPYTMAIYDWTSEDAVFYNGLILGCSGFLSFCAYFVYAVYGKRFIRERLFITVGLCMLCSFYFLTYPWPFYTRKLDYQYQSFTAPALNYTGTKRDTSSASTTSLNVNNATTASVMFENVTQEAVGCDIDFKWCEYTPWVPPEVYFTFYPLISLGFPTVNVALSTLYSKILGPRRQSTMQSLLIMAGSCARLIGPIFISTLFQLYGPRVGWGIIAAAVGTSIVASIVFRRKLVPLNVNRSLQAGQSMVYGKGTLYKF